MRKIILLFICIISTIVLFGCDRSAVSGENEDNIENIQNTIENDMLTNDLPAFEYSFDPHVISKEYISLYGSGTEECFYRFCDAVLNGESTFECSTIDELYIVLSISRNCFPIASEFIDKDKCNVVDGVGYLHYRIETDELLNEISKFKNKVTEVITSAVPYEEEDFIIAAELLTAVANKDEYDDNAESLAMIVQPYRAIMGNKGICQEIVGEYIYYLLQVGINATTCDGITKSSEGHTWTVIELDGEHYHVDPTFTISHKDSLAFFCMDDEKRERFGDIEFDMDSIGFADSNEIHYEMHDQKYKDLWEAESYTIDHENKIIHITTFDSGEEKRIPFIH